MSAGRTRFVYALRALGRRAGRAVSVGLALALVTASVCATQLLGRSLAAEARAGDDALPDLVVQRLVGGRPALVDPAEVASLASRPGVRSVRPRLFGYLYLAAIEANLTVVALDPSTPPDGLGLVGRLPRAPRELVLGPAAAERLGVRLGDRVAMPAADGFASFRVVGLFPAGSSLRTADLTLVPADDARALLGIPEGRATDVAVEVVDPDEIRPVADELRRALPGARVLTRPDVTRLHALTFGARSGLATASLLPAVLCLLLLAWERLTGLDVRERREIAVLKALGWSTADVLVVRAVESATVAFVGTSVGFVLGYVYVFGAGAPLLADALFGWSRLVPTFALVPHVSPLDYLSALGLVSVPFVATSVVPAYLAANADPMHVWRHT